MKHYTIQEIKNLKNQPSHFATLTAYDFISAQILDEAQIPLILVGDSASMTIYGYNTTVPVTMAEMMLVVKAVTRGAKNSLVVADMPFLSYQSSIEDTIKNAGKLIKEGGAAAVKLEGGKKVVNIIKYLTQKGIPVMGHIGLLPQSSTNFKLKGKSVFQKKKILEDAKAISEAGAFAIVVECVVESLAKEITNSISVPTIGIGASKYCDGQILVINDVIGLSDFSSKFVKQYANVSGIIEKSVRNYCKDVRTRRFPSPRNVYRY